MTRKVFIGMLFLFVNLLIIKITDDMLFDNMILFVIPLIILFIIESVFKYGQNIFSMICNFLVVR
jgi:hypothetical protein